MLPGRLVRERIGVGCIGHGVFVIVDIAVVVGTRAVLVRAQIRSLTVTHRMEPMLRGEDCGAAVGSFGGFQTDLRTVSTSLGVVIF